MALESFSYAFPQQVFQLCKPHKFWTQSHDRPREPPASQSPCSAAWSSHWDAPGVRARVARAPGPRFPGRGRRCLEKKTWNFVDLSWVSVTKMYSSRYCYWKSTVTDCSLLKCTAYHWISVNDFGRVTSYDWMTINQWCQRMITYLKVMLSSWSFNTKYTGNE